MAVWIRICLAAMLLNVQAMAIEAVTSYTLFYQPAADAYKPYIELYWQIDPRTVLMGQRPDNQWGGTVQTQIVISSDTGIVVNDQFALQTTPQASREYAQVQTIIDLQRYSLPTGKMKLEITFRDGLKPQNAYTYSDTFTVLPSPIGPFYSNLQLIDTSYAAQTKSVFQKNNQVQIPLSMNFIGDERSALRFYSELYHLDKALKDGPFIQTSYISKKPGESAVYGLLITDTIAMRTAVTPFLGSFDISTLPSGNYYLNIALQNNRKENIAASNLFFQRSNTTPVVKKIEPDTSKVADTGVFAPVHKVTIFDLGGSFVGKFTMPQLRAVLRMLMPVANANELASINGFLDKPDDTYIRYFIYNFWKERVPADPEKGWEEYTTRIKDVNKLFGGGSARGYETERGQIYLKYGKPNERILALNEPGALPYEVWQYNAPGKQSSQGIFLFYRPASMISDMVLLHSTVNGETRNMQWRRLLYVNGGSGDNTGSRAEQYLPATFSR